MRKKCTCCKKIREIVISKGRTRSWCRSCKNRKVRQWHKEHKGERRNTHLKHQYGITLRRYNLMLRKQHRVCLICGLPPTKKCPTLGVDHNHITGKVRGLLCRRCNIIVGVVENDLYLEAIKYLQRYDN